MEHTHLHSGHVQMATIDPESQMKSSLSDSTWLEYFSMG